MDLLFINTVLTVLWYIGFIFWLVYRFTSFFSFIFGVFKGFAQTLKCLTDCMLWMKYKINDSGLVPRNTNRYTPLDNTNIQYTSELETGLLNQYRENEVNIRDANSREGRETTFSEFARSEGIPREGTRGKERLYMAPKLSPWDEDENE